MKNQIPEQPFLVHVSFHPTDPTEKFDYRTFHEKMYESGYMRSLPIDFTEPTYDHKTGLTDSSMIVARILQNYYQSQRNLRCGLYFARKSVNKDDVAMEVRGIAKSILVEDAVDMHGIIQVFPIGSPYVLSVQSSDDPAQIPTPARTFLPVPFRPILIA